MKKILIALAVMASFSAFAQTNTSATNASDSAAVNQGISLINNSFAQPVTASSTDARLQTNQAQSVAPSFASQASQQTCSAAGVGMAIQLPGGGASFAGGNGMDVGCDLGRDLNFMKALGATPDEMLARACMKPELKATMKKCSAEKSASVGIDPFIASSGRAYPSAQ